jgi:hypothetical protein
MGISTQTDRPGQLILRKPYFEQFAAGTKTTEYRRYKGQFTQRNFWPGRLIRIAYRYDHAAAGLPHLLAAVRSFETRQARWGTPLFAEMREVYADLLPGDDIALIGLDVVDRVGC